MSTIIKSSDEDVIAIPAWLMEALNLEEGDQVKPIIEGQNMRLASLDRFLALRGALSEDEDFDQAMEYIDQAWQTWTTTLSV